MNTPTCSCKGCEKPITRGFCGEHWIGSGLIKYRRGPKGPIADRFWPKVDQSGNCWIWTAARDPNGYGRFRVGGRNGSTQLAHRVAWELLIGPIAKGMTLDHLCRTHACVRPAHMEIVTMGINVLRGNSLSALNARKTHCLNGHEFTPENTRISTSRTHGRECRECDKLRAQRARDRKRVHA